MRLLRWLSRCWRMVVAAALVIVLALGVLYWQLSRFPAAVEALDGTPFVLQVQSGVPAADLDQVRRGLRIMDAYLHAHAGVGVTGPVEVRVTWTDGCKFYLRGPDAGPAAWVDGADFICLNPSQWRSDGYAPAWIPAHEHVHNLQAQLGCFAGPDEHEWQWLFEGMASHLAFEALLAADLVSAADAELYVWEYRGLEPDAGSLADYERSSDTAGDAYGLFYLGARVLADQAGSAAAFVDFCRAAADDVPWRDAFAASFGVTVPELYALVEAERVRLRPEYDCAEPPCGTATPPP